MSKRRICVVTGSRAEYGLLYWLLKEIASDSECQLQLIVTGTHLSREYGLTYKEIEKSFTIDMKIALELEDNSGVGVSKSLGIAIGEFAEAYENLEPDLLLILGDRYEVFAAASAAMITCLPIAHLHGGETTEGAFDEAIRHSITKMSHLHFTATNEYKNRVIQLGEDPSSVYMVGALGIENIRKLPLLTRDEFQKSIGFSLGEKNILVTFHPSTLEEESASKQFQVLLDVIAELKDTNVIFTQANSDPQGKTINNMITKYVTEHKMQAISFASLGQLRYLSALQFVDAVVGNSSSGIIEAPSFNIATINIGDRQKGRVKAKSVIDTNVNKDSIRSSFSKIYSEKFQNTLKSVDNPYDNGLVSQKIKNILKCISLENILKKQFYDIKVES